MLGEGNVCENTEHTQYGKLEEKKHKLKDSKRKLNSMCWLGWTKHTASHKITLLDYFVLATTAAKIGQAYVCVNVCVWLFVCTHPTVADLIVTAATCLSNKMNKRQQSIDNSRLKMSLRKTEWSAAQVRGSTHKHILIQLFLFFYIHKNGLYVNRRNCSCKSVLL